MTEDDWELISRVRGVAWRLRSKYPPPIPTMSVPVYAVHEAMNALADAIDEEFG